MSGSFCFVDRRDGEEIENTGKYLEIVRPRRLVFTWATTCPGAKQYSQDINRVMIDIVPLGTGAELTLTHEVHPDAARSTEAGWTIMLDAMAETLDHGSGRAASTTPEKKGQSL